MRLLRWVGFAALSVVVWLFVASFVHVFQSAAAAARKAGYLQSAKALAKAIRLYAGSSDGRLPGSDWRRPVEQLAPGLALSWNEGGQRIGFATVPGTPGKRLAALPDEALVFVLCRGDSDLSTLDDPQQIARVDDPPRAVVLTAKGIRDGYASRRVPLAQVVAALRRQRAFGSVPVR